jgi:hypothetical protein
LYQGLETEKIFAVLLEASAGDAPPDPAALAAALPENDRRLLFEILFESGAQATWQEAESCLVVLRRRKAKAELDMVQRQIEAQPPMAAVAGGLAGGSSADLRHLLAKKQELRKRLDEMGG